MTEQELLERITLRPRKLIVSKPKLMGMSAQVRTDGGLYLPEIANRGRREWGMLTRVLKTGEQCEKEGVAKGSVVLITEFAGMPLWYCGHEMNLWLIALGDIVGVVTDATGVQLDEDSTTQ